MYIAMLLPNPFCDYILIKKFVAQMVATDKNFVG